MKRREKMKKRKSAVLLLLVFALFMNILTVPVQGAAEGLVATTIAEAQRAIRAAMKNFKATDQTTQEEFLKVATDALGEGSPVTLEIYNYKVVPATAEWEGQVSATLVISDGKSPSYAMETGAKIPRITSDDEKKMEEVLKAMHEAMSKVPVSNQTTQEELTKAATGAMKYGATVVWTSFKKVDATFEKEGSILGYLDVTLNSVKREQLYQRKIPKRERKMPTKQLKAKGRNLTGTEWEALRQTNIERHKKGLSLLTMVQPLQGVTCVRAKEEYSEKKANHSRPDGSSFSTAVPSSFKNAGLGENLFQCKTGTTVDATRAVNSWMNSAAHRANILKPSFHYIGITILDHLAVQVFAVSKNKITSYSTSTGKKSFNSVDEMEEAYLICKDSAGVKSYLPLDTDYMKKVKGGYTIKLNSKKTIKLTVKESSALTESQFTDVDAKDAKAVAWVTSKKYMTGTSKTKFSPKSACTRADVLTCLYKANGSPTPPSKNWFADVKSTDPFYKPALWAQDKGLVDWGLLYPNDLCTRGDAIYFVWMSVGAPAPKKQTTFTDLPTEWEVFYAKALAWGEENGLIENTGDNCFHGSDWSCSRADMAHFLYGAYK